MSKRSREKQKQREEAETAARGNRGEMYTVKEVAALMQRDPMLIDDRRLPCLCLIPGRYYSRFFFFNFPKDVNPPYGGDVTGFLWCRQDDPRTWYLLWRFRYYAGKRLWSGEDRRSWYGSTLKDMDEAQAAEKIVMGFGLISMVAEQKMDVFVIEGDHDRASRLMADPLTRPFWMHMNAMPTDEFDKGTDPAKWAKENEIRETN